MATATKQAKKTTEKKSTEDRYFYAVGRRKTAVTQARVYPIAEAKEMDITINGKDFKTYFQTVRLQALLLGPLTLTGTQTKFRVTLVAHGGGISGQADAARLAIARALVEYDAALRPVLKANKLLVRDAREVERKKPGKRKARRSPQWSKR